MKIHFTMNIRHPSELSRVFREDEEREAEGQDEYQKPAEIIAPELPAEAGPAMA